MDLAVKKMGRALPALAAVMIFILLLFEPEAALDGAKSGLALCASTIIPSLFPFFVLSALLSAVDVPAYLGKRCAPVMSRLFSVSGAGAAAFILGLSGGYPLGAATISDLALGGDIGKEEAGRLLAFCNNSGPAFIVGAAGIGIFGSSGIGLMLYLIHILAAGLVGILFAGKRKKGAPNHAPASAKPQKLSQAFPACVKASVTSVLGVCGFVVFFSVMVRMLDAVGIFISLSGSIALKTGAGLSSVRALLTGILELGSGIGAMSGVPATPHSLALAAFILGWGGISVHCQTLSVIENGALPVSRYFPGKLLHGLISALFAFCAGMLFIR